MKDKILHMCLEAPSDFLAWVYINIGDKCKQCGEIITKGDNNDDE